MFPACHHPRRRRGFLFFLPGDFSLDHTVKDSGLLKAALHNAPGKMLGNL